MRKTLTTLALGATLALSLSACGGDDSINSSDREKASAAALAAVGGGTVTDAGLGDGDDGYAFDVEVALPNGEDVDVELDENFKVTNNPPTVSDFANAAPTTAAPTTTAPQSSDNDDDAPLTGSTLTQASAAALKAAGGGKVTETSQSDDADHAYEVEVTFTNGEDVTVELNKDFGVTKIDR